MSGGILTRCRLDVYVFYAFVMGAFSYPVIAHVAWGDGYFAQLGFKDYAGSCVVHLFGGMCALVGAFLCGPRVGRFGFRGDGQSAHNGKAYMIGGNGGSAGASEASEADEDFMETRAYTFLRRVSCRSRRVLRCLVRLSGHGFPDQRIRRIPGHSSTFVAMGGLLLFIGWFSFNAGSSGGLSNNPAILGASVAGVNTCIAAGTATTMGFLWCTFYKREYDVEFVVNCLLGGLVAITAPSGYIEPWAAAVVGVLCPPVVHFASFVVLEVMRIDDPLDAAAVHGGCGLLGALWLGLADPTDGVFYTGLGGFFAVQIYGCLFCMAWATATTLAVFGPFKLAHKLTYTEDEQLVGLDFVHFGGSSYPEFDAEAVMEFNAAKRIENQMRAQDAPRNMRRESISISRVPSMANITKPGHLSATPSQHGSFSGPSFFSTVASKLGRSGRGSEDGPTAGTGGSAVDSVIGQVRRDSEDLSVRDASEPTWKVTLENPNFTGPRG